MGFSVRLLVHSGSPRAFSPRDDKVWGNGGVRFGYITIIVIARRERSEGGGNPPCLRVTRTGLSLRLLVHTGSPRAFCPRDDKVW